MRSRSFLAVLAALGSIVGATLVTAVAAPSTSVEAAGPTSSYVAMATSQRLVDTRQSSPVAAGATISIEITGAAPLPATGTVTAAVLNLTVTPPSGPGFWTVWPHTSPRPEASNLNVDELQFLSGNVTPNLVTVPVGADGVVDVYSSAGGNVIVDLLGYYTPAATATAGRFEPLAAATRVLDTRGAATFAAGETRAFTVPGAAGASAVAVNLTAVTNTPGFWQVSAQGSPVPDTSNLNSPAGRSAAIANQAIVSVDTNGAISIYSQSGGDLIIDLVGTYTGAGAPDSSAGLFVPMTSPTRIVDTRIAGLNPLGGTKRPSMNTSFEVPVASNPTIGRADVSAVVLNATTVDALTVGFITVGTAGATDPKAAPTTSTMNVVRPAQMLANHAIVPVSSRGFSMFTEPGGHLLADLAGYFIGTPAGAPFGPRVNPAAPTCSTQTVGEPAAAVGPIINGSSRASVANLQNRLLALGFWSRRLGDRHRVEHRAVPTCSGSQRRPARSRQGQADRVRGARWQGAARVQRVHRQRQVLRRGRSEECRPKVDRDRPHAHRHVQHLPRTRRLPVRGHPRHALPAEVRHRRYRGARRPEGAELSCVTRMRTRRESGDGLHLEPEPAAVAFDGMDPRLIRRTKMGSYVPLPTRGAT